MDFAETQPVTNAEPRPLVPCQAAQFRNTYVNLPARFFANLRPTPVADPHLIKFNTKLAATLDLHLSETDPHELAQIFAGNTLLPGAQPIAMAYAGHQFGGFVPQLGDGRALLLGEVVSRDQTRYDIQLKGAGPTPYSRRGDGRAALGPVLREYLVSEAMHAIGIPATRALAAVTTGEEVFRETVLPGAILTRVAASHVRVGTFQYFAARADVDGLKILADHVIGRHYPDVGSYLGLLEAVVEAQACLIAGWMRIGFIHGVMNTDNMAISGQTIDFGPCAFMENYDPATVFSAIDQYGRYAYANQPKIAQWNLARFAETLLPLLDEDQDRALEQASTVINGFSARYQAHYRTGFGAKLGFAHEEPGDLEIINALLAAMQDNEADFTLTFRELCDAATGDDKVRNLFNTPAAYDEWAKLWHSRLAREDVAPGVRAAAMRRVNPAFIPRNHRVEQAIVAATSGDFSLFHELCGVLENPYDEQPAFVAYMAPAEAGEAVRRTFCGT